MSLEMTNLESVYLGDTFYMAKTILDLEIFLNLYYLGNFNFCYSKRLKSPAG